LMNRMRPHAVLPLPPRVITGTAVRVVTAPGA
jgi:hypothetical protein